MITTCINLTESVNNKNKIICGGIKMKKIIMTLITIIVIMTAVVLGIILYEPKEKPQNETTIKEIAEEEILDECTDEYEQNEIMQTNASEEKISPNASITLKKHYKACGHTTSEYREVAEELVNKTKSEMEKIYKDWKVEKFSDADIVLIKEEAGTCGEHYVVRDKDGRIAIFEVQKDGTEKECEITDIYTEYLTETDKNSIKKGIFVNGKQNLNQLIEDFE